MNYFTPRDLLNSISGRTFGIAVIDIRASLEYERSHILSTLYNFDYDRNIKHSATKNEVKIKLFSEQKIRSCFDVEDPFVVFLGGGFLRLF
jgi:rhodanese-related sulfurtransferase